MPPSDKHHREHCSTTERRTPDSDENSFDCDALLLESECEAEMPYYVEVAGDYSIPHATADHWATRGKAVDDESTQRRTSVKRAPRRKSY